MPPRRPKTRQIRWDWIILASIVLLIAGWGALKVVWRPSNQISRVVIGKNDEVYYSANISLQQAQILGEALQSTGFFAGRGSSVFLSRHKKYSVVSFVLNNGGWDHPGTLAGFEEIGRRIAYSVGGFPIELHLVDSAWKVRQAAVVGKVISGTRDIIYYMGTATERDAENLGRALREAGYLQDYGVTVTLSRGGTPFLGFVVGDGVWDQPQARTGFQDLVRRAASTVGGLPIELRLLNPDMELKYSALVQ